MNADLIAAGLSPFNPEVAAIKAARLMLREIDECASKGESFSFETTLSGLNYHGGLKIGKLMVILSKIWFISLHSADIAVSRVAERVRQGGHNIPEAIIRRRFTAGLINFLNKYRTIVDAWALYDGTLTPPKLIEWS